MKRARLRSKTGCLRCRARRVKCDEITPLCSPCKRLGIYCFWPPNSNIARYNATSSSAVDVPPVSRNLSQIQRLPMTRSLFMIPLNSSTNYQIDLVLKWPELYKIFIAPAASRESRDLSVFIPIALQEEVVRHVLAACAACMLMHHTGQRHLEIIVLRNYQQAITTLKEATARLNTKQECFALHIASGILNLVEVCKASLPARPVVFGLHWMAAASWWSQSLPEAVHRPGNKGASRLVLEIWLHEIMAMSMVVSREQLDGIIKVIPGDYLDDLFAPTPGTRAARYQMSPHGLLPYKLFLTIIKIMHMARSEDMKLNRENYTAYLWQELDTLEAEQTIHYGHSLDLQARASELLARLHIATLRIILLKVANPRFCSSTPEIRWRVEMAFEIWNLPALQGMDLTWQWCPMLIMTCAARDEQTFRQLVEQGVKRQTQAVGWVEIERAVAKARKQPPCEGPQLCSQKHDGLHLLINKDGFNLNSHQSGEATTDGPMWDAAGYKPFEDGDADLA